MKKRLYAGCFNSGNRQLAGCAKFIDPRFESGAKFAGPYRSCRAQFEVDSCPIYLVEGNTDGLVMQACNWAGGVEKGAFAPRTRHNRYSRF